MRYLTLLVAVVLCCVNEAARAAADCSSYMPRPVDIIVCNDSELRALDREVDILSNSVSGLDASQQDRYATSAHFLPRALQTL